MLVARMSVMMQSTSAFTICFPCSLMSFGRVTVTLPIFKYLVLSEVNRLLSVRFLLIELLVDSNRFLR